MAIVLITRIAILVVIFIGALLSITAIAGNEWQQLELPQGIMKETFGLWKVCKEIKGLSNDCGTLKVSELADTKLEGWCRLPYLNYLIFNPLVPDVH